MVSCLAMPAEPLTSAVSKAQRYERPSQSHPWEAGKHCEFSLTPTTGIPPSDLFAALITTIRAQILAEHHSQPQTSLKRLLTPKEAGEYISRSESAVRQMIFKKQLVVTRIGRNIRLDRRDLDRLIDDSKV
jgi:excisionase family DNA binding protein